MKVEVVTREEFEQAMQVLGLLLVYSGCGHEVEGHWIAYPKCRRAYGEETEWRNPVKVRRFDE